jgi:hypothetical protein
MHPRTAVTLSNENGPIRSRPSLHSPPGACARYKLTTAARRPNPPLAHPPAGREGELMPRTHPNNDGQPCSNLRSAGRRS